MDIVCELESHNLKACAATLSCPIYSININELVSENALHCIAQWSDIMTAIWQDDMTK